MTRDDWILLLLSLLVVLSAGYRLYALDTDSFWIDESYTVVAARATAEHGVPLLDSGREYWRAWPQTYLLAGIGAMFGFDHIPMRALSALAGIALVPLAFFLLRRRIGDASAILSAGLIALSYTEIAWSRQARMYIFVQLAVLLALCAYLSWRDSPSWTRFSLVVLWTVLGVLLHASALLLPIAFALHFLLVERPHPKMMLQNFLDRHPVQRWVIVGMVAVVALGAMIYAQRYLSIIRTVDYVQEYRLFLVGAHYPIIFLAGIGVFAEVRRWKTNALFLLFSTLLFLMASFLVLLQSPRYLLAALPLLYVFAAQGMVYLYEAYRSIAYRFVAIACIIILLLSSGFLFLPRDSYALETATPKPPFSPAYDFLSTQIAPDDLLLVTQPAIASLYLRTPDAWIGFSYTNLPMSRENIVDQTTGRELYVGAQSILSAEDLNASLAKKGFIVIDDMGFSRLDPARRDMIRQQSLIATFGDEYWSTVYIYRFPSQ